MRPTASKISLLAFCQWWARDEAEWSDSTSDAADRGARFHRAIAEYITTSTITGVDVDRDADIAQLLYHAIEWVHQRTNPDTPMLAEQAYAWDLRTDTAIRLDAKDRDYAGHEPELCGTADVVMVDTKRRWGYVGDWKTGDGSRASWQLRTLACMVARVHDLDEVFIESLEVSETGVESRYSESMGGVGMFEAWLDVRDWVEAILTSAPSPGSHCTEHYCPAIATCPSTRAVVAQVIPTEHLTHRWGITVQSPDHAAWLYEHARLVEGAAKRVRESVRAYVPESGVQLSDGRTLREGTRQVTRVDHRAIRELAEYHGATPAELDACTRVAAESAGLRILAAKTVGAK